MWNKCKPFVEAFLIYFLLIGIPIWIWFSPLPEGCTGYLAIWVMLSTGTCLYFVSGKNCTYRKEVATFYFWASVISLTLAYIGYVG